MEYFEKTGFEQLEVWKRSILLTKKVFVIANDLRQFGRLKEQLTSSALSISSNIAEGKGRTSTSEFRHFLVIARGSAYECLSQLHVLNECDLIKKEDFLLLRQELIEIIKMISGLRNSIYPRR